MADVKRAKKSEAPQLVLRFFNKEPVSAAELGKLFAALARDYRRVNKGRTLVIAHLQVGSIVAHLYDAYTAVAPWAKTAVEIAEGSNALWKFFETVRKLIKRPRDLFKGKSDPGVKSAEIILDITIHGGGQVQLESKARNIKSIRVTSQQAITIRAKQRRIRKRAKQRSRSRRQFQ